MRKNEAQKGTNDRNQMPSKNKMRERPQCQEKALEKDQTSEELKDEMSPSKGDLNMQELVRDSMKYDLYKKQFILVLK